MDNRAQVREFLASRRARITPDLAGLPAYGGNHRVKGLRREEVALLQENLLLCSARSSTSGRVRAVVDVGSRA